MIARPIQSALGQEQHYYYPNLPQNLYIPSTPDYDLTYHQPKRVKIEPAYISAQNPSSSSGPTNTLYGTTLHQAQLGAPHYNFPASPVTVATTLSQHSTPSRSPSRVSESSAHDYHLLYDDTLSQSKGFNPLTQQHQPSPPHSQPSSYPLPMDSNYPTNYYNGFTTDLDLAKFSEQQYLNPFNPTSYPGVPHISTEDDLPALSPSHYSSSRIHSTSEGALHSPMTPMGSPGSHGRDMTPASQASASHIHNSAPKLARTVTDAVEDELYTGHSMMTPPKTQHLSKKTLPTVPASIATFYQKAQSDHAEEAKRSTTSVHFAATRDRSPFRTNSPFHPMRTPQGAQGAQPAPVRHSNFLPQGFVMTARSQREQQHHLDAQSQVMAEAHQLSSTPKTMSPKDSVLEYPEPEDEASKLSLFSHENNDNGYAQGSGQYAIDSFSAGRSYNNSDMGKDESERNYKSRRTSEADSLPSTGAYSYNSSPQLPMATQSYPYMQAYGSGEMPTSSNSNADKQTKAASPATKPSNVRADTGAYTCTAPGCKQRFPTPAKLQKHRRESHRQSTPAGAAGMTSTLHTPLSRHQGPHKCTRNNPTTGKPCNTVFSRPYDLTRHEDTIHNTTREKVRCELCNDEKTFSRQDALTRHKKVKHGIDK